jgi:hypothetical protein
MLRGHHIYSRTSLFPGQRLRLTASEEDPVQTSASEIIALTLPRWGAVRPAAPANTICLFVTGTVVRSRQQKDHLLQVLEDLNRTASGRSAAKAIEALKYLYARQEEEIRHGRDERALDWWIAYDLASVA